jgi:hypothetical protein
MPRFAILPALLLACLCAPAAAAAPDPAIEKDWAAQDGLYAGGVLKPAAVRKVLEEAGAAGAADSGGAAALEARFDALSRQSAPPADPRWFDLYRQACEARRAVRLRPHLDRIRKVVFTKHYDLGGSHYAYTEGQSDAQNERHFVPGAALCLLEMDGLYGKVRTLVDAPGGVIRDPDVSYDAARILFAWKKSDREDDYHLYELTAADGKVRQLTSGLGYADYEGAYLPTGDIIFSSTRCVQSVDCWWTEVSNMYTCDRDGRCIRRLGYDQVHTNYPTVTPDGRVLYTRWEYNDRGQIFVQSLWQMFPDGTGQTAFYGNNSWFPTAALHARAIPGTEKVVCIFSGHHTRQNGQLGVLDPTRGREENSGAQLIAPVRKTDAVHVDAYGQTGDQFQYPYPLSETEFLVTFRPEAAEAGQKHFAIYFMTADGRRELLARDDRISCNQPVPLAARPAPHERTSPVDYRKATGTVVLQDVYAGPGLEGVPRGSVKTLRVVSLEFRAAAIGSNFNSGPAGGAMASTPVSIGNGAWDPKIVLGEATVYDDGSACFTVPARTPIYFQAMDAKGRVIQTMRSWATLMPGETQSCVGCHEDKNSSPPVTRATQALKAGPQALKPWYGPPRGFSFPREIQPILDRHCIRCHNLPPEDPARAGAPVVSAAKSPPASAAAPAGAVKPAFSLLGKEVLDEEAKRKWSEAYLALTGCKRRDREKEPFTGQSSEVVNWIGVQSVPTRLPPYFAGAAKSRLMTMLEQGHYGVGLSREEMDKVACWIDLLVPYCGDYVEANAWSPKEAERYEHFAAKRKRSEAEEAQNVAEFLRTRTPSP